MILQYILQAYLWEENRETIIHLLKGLQKGMCISTTIQDARGFF